MPSSKDGKHAVPGSTSHSRSPPPTRHHGEQQAAPAQFGKNSADRQPLPAAQSLMYPHGSPGGMSWIMKTQLKSVCAQ